MKTYVVQKGDTMWLISKRYGITLDSLIAANPQIADPDRIDVGWVLNIPVGEPVPTMPPCGPMEYTVMPGDTLWLISKKFGIPLEDIIKANPQIADPNKINIGQIIIIPAKVNCPPTTPPLPTISPLPGAPICPPMHMYPMHPMKPMPMPMQPMPMHPMPSMPGMPEMPMMPPMPAPTGCDVVIHHMHHFCGCCTPHQMMPGMEGMHQMHQKHHEHHHHHKECMPHMMHMNPCMPNLPEVEDECKKKSHKEKHHKD